tara:strand:+ start:552 stop:1214 length:663 start_codon:yes stop_codon:yes gene_type:complete
MTDLEKFEFNLSYEFKDKDLLKLALTHKSFSKINNEKLEFFGDSILSMVISEFIIDRYPELDEGELSRFRAALVKRETLNEIAHSLDIRLNIQIGKGEKVLGTSIEGNALEAIIAAIYLDSDSDLEVCKKVISALFKSLLSEFEVDNGFKDSKSKLQEYLQKKGITLPIYTTLEDLNKSHLFEVACIVEDLNIRTIGKGSNTKKAQLDAAEKALRIIDRS